MPLTRGNSLTRTSAPIPQVAGGAQSLDGDLSQLCEGDIAQLDHLIGRGEAEHLTREGSQRIERCHPGVH